MVLLYHGRHFCVFRFELCTISTIVLRVALYVHSLFMIV